jgi:hypothetical protein
MATNTEIDLPHLGELGSSDIEGPGIIASPTEDDESRRSLDPVSEDVNEQDKDINEKSSQPGHNDSHGEIVWRYLMFETELPHPSNIHATTAGQEPPPDPPNLAKFSDPFQWSEARKNLTMWIACIITTLTAFSAGACT